LQAVVFAVTSTDVNHGVGSMTSGRLLTQTQGMPGYINRVQYTTKPGTYRLLCLEAAASHHDMIDG
jgi:heme/copper-type cytochrome/quinol oxidase subunit 2